MKLISIKIAIVTLLLIVSCGGGSDDSPTPTPVPTPQQMVPNPKATTLIFPEDNTECNEGTVIDDTQSRVTFQWNTAEDADSYEISIKNIHTNQITSRAVNEEEINLTIERGVPFEWFVTSKATGTTVTADSPKFKFYNQGLGIENYAPFPAEVIHPARGAVITNSDGTVNLKWKGTDIDHDIVEYELLFGTDQIPNESLGTTTKEDMDVSVTIGTIYYWRVIITDAQNHTSQSEVFEFKVSS